MSNKLKNLVWLLISFLAVAWLVKGMDKELVMNAFSQTKMSWAISAVILFAVAQAALAKRWTILLSAHSINISFLQAVKLTFLGLFYNNFMPGSVGGDLLKGWYATHHCPSDKKIHAAISVLLDRILGLTGTLILGSVAALSMKESFSLPVAGHNIDIREVIIAIIIVIFGFGALTASRRIRNALMINKLLKLLPFQKKLKEVENGLRIYRNSPGALIGALIATFVVQTMAITSIWLLCVSLGLEGITLRHCITIMPIVWVISATVPVPGGLGVIENLMVPFFVAAADQSAFESPEVLTARVMTLTILNRMMIYISSAPGGLVPIFGGHLPKKDEMAKEIEDIEK